MLFRLYKLKKNSGDDSSHVLILPHTNVRFGSLAVIYSTLKCFNLCACCSQFFPSNCSIVISIGCLSKQRILMSKPSGFERGMQNDFIPHDLQKRCFASPESKVYVVRLSFPCSNLNFDFGTIRCKYPDFEQIEQLQSWQVKFYLASTSNLIAPQWQPPE